MSGFYDPNYKPLPLIQPMDPWAKMAEYEALQQNQLKTVSEQMSNQLAQINLEREQAEWGVEKPAWKNALDQANKPPSDQGLPWGGGTRPSYAPAAAPP